MKTYILMINTLFLSLALSLTGCAEEETSSTAQEGGEATEEEGGEATEEEGGEATEEEGGESTEEEGGESTEEEGGEATEEEGGDGDTIVYSGTTQDWLSDANGSGFTVCVYTHTR